MCRYRLTCCLVVAAALSCATGWTATLTITATFTYTGPDGAQHPCRFAWCELRDYDPARDDVIAEGYTDAEGTVVFRYDSETGDGIGGGRIDPYVRCWSRLNMPYGDDRFCKAHVVKQRRLSVTNLDFAYYEINTQRWDDNNSDRTVTASAGGDEDAPFFIMDCLATANLPTPGRAIGGAYRARMALGASLCSGEVVVVYSSPLGTNFLPLTDEIYFDEEGGHEFDAIVHEYGHHEMSANYGGWIGEYDRTEWGEHNFESTFDNEWSAFCEGWAEFCPVIVKGYPNYRNTYDVEDPIPNLGSSRCEGTVCRILWDLADTRETPVVDADWRPVARTPVGGLTLDDDPFGFANCAPWNSLPGLESLKDIIRDHNPKSLTDLRANWESTHGTLSLAHRALQAVCWGHGVREGIVNHPPAATLTIEGASAPGGVTNGVRQPTIWAGDLTLRAVVDDEDILDHQLLHVYFCWAYLGLRSGLLPAGGEHGELWNLIGVDVDGSDGFSCTWARNAPRPVRTDLPLCVTAVASDFFEDSAYRLAPAEFTPAQVGPIVVRPSILTRWFMVEIELSGSSKRWQLDLITPGVQASVEEVPAPVNYPSVAAPSEFNDYETDEGAEDTGTASGHTCIAAYERAAPTGAITGRLRVLLEGVPDNGVVRLGIANGGDGMAARATLRSPVGPTGRPELTIHSDGYARGEEPAHYGEYWDVDLTGLGAEISVPLPPPPPPGG